MRTAVTVFLDTANIYVGAQHSVPRQSFNAPLRLQFDALRALAVAGRPCRDAVASATCTDRNGAALNAARRAGFRVFISEPGRYTGQEQHVDERLQLEMYRATRMAPAHAVLLTGDGRDNDGQDGFIPAVQALTDQGWTMDLLGWDASRSARLNQAVLAAGGIVEALDRYWTAITYEQNGRNAQPLSLRHRRLPLALLGASAA